MKTQILILFWFLTYNVSTGQSLGAVEILDKSIAYHDPNNHWKTFRGKFQLDEMRETGTRKTQFLIDNNQGLFQFERDSTVHGMLMDSCFNTRGTTPCERVSTIRNYYLYLWGLPMKLKDQVGELREQVSEIDFHGTRVYQIEVHYERENWSYFIDKQNFALVGYQFYFNHKDGGELIKLSDEYVYKGMRFPKERTWYEMPGETYLARDVLKAIK